MPTENGVGYRLSLVEEDLKETRVVADLGVTLGTKHDIELHGERGVYKALEDLTHQLQWTQRALWGLAVAILVAAAAASFH